MQFVKPALSIVGVLLILVGLLWMGQGSGLFPYPESSFMINQTPWIINGAIAALAGLALIWSTRRFIRRH